MGRIGRLASNECEKIRDPLAIHIGKRILSARRRERVSLRKTAESAGLSVAYVCDLENGKRMPTIKTLMKLSKAFDVTVGYWIYGYSGDF